MRIDVHSYGNGCVLIVFVRIVIIMLFEKRNLCGELLLSTQREIPRLHATSTKPAEGEQGAEESINLLFTITQDVLFVAKCKYYDP